jgi:hypothetical protein
MGAVIAVGGLLNESEGYSATIPFWFHDTNSSTAPKQLTYAEAGIMVGNPDAMMMPGFPKGTTFSPYLVLRNSADKPLDVSLQLNCTMGIGGSAPVTQDLPSQFLRPFEARQVNLQAALDAAGLKKFDGSINLSTSITGKPGDLVLATGSVDQAGTYVFEVEPQGVGPSRSKFAGYWGVSNGNDTMFSLWNPTNSAQDILVTFYYGDGSGKYSLPVHLGPQASTMIDMAMLIAENKPDPDGHLIPSNIREGSTQFANANGRNEMMTVAIAGGIYNVSTATCISDCIWCCGVGNFGISPNPLSCSVGDTPTWSSTAKDCNGNNTIGPSISSNNTDVATVDLSSSTVSCLSPGQATLTATWGNAIQANGNQQFCGISSCPTQTGFAQDTVIVKPKLTSISPTLGMIGVATNVTLSGAGFISGQTTVDAGSNIAVSQISVSSSTQLTAVFTPTNSTSAGGNQSVTVSVNGQPSNSQTFYNQLPTLVQVIGTTAQGAAVCPAKQHGWSRLVTDQLFDQGTSPRPITAAGVVVADSIVVTTPNALGIRGTVTGSFNTDANGSWPDSYFVCSTVCPRSTGETDAQQNWTANNTNLPHVNAVVYKCSSITVDGN